MAKWLVEIPGMQTAEWVKTYHNGIQDVVRVKWSNRMRAGNRTRYMELPLKYCRIYKHRPWLVKLNTWWNNLKPVVYLKNYYAGTNRSLVKIDRQTL